MNGIQERGLYDEQREDTKRVQNEARERARRDARREDDREDRRER